MFSFPGLPQLDTKLVLWSLKAVQVATALLSLFGKEVVKVIYTLVWPFIAWPYSYYKLGKASRPSRRGSERA